MHHVCVCAISIHCSVLLPFPLPSLGLNEIPSGVYPGLSDGFVAAAAFPPFSFHCHCCIASVRAAIIEISKHNKVFGCRFGGYLSLDCVIFSIELGAITLKKQNMSDMTLIEISKHVLRLVFVCR